jgi:hypothetical protein
MPTHTQEFLHSMRAKGKLPTVEVEATVRKHSQNDFTATRVMTDRFEDQLGLQEATKKLKETQR